ncbi:MAG: FMN-binding protein [Acetatifactor sp.]|nr:FMN-binding protein [Acetatifactor sp.]
MLKEAGILFAITLLAGLLLGLIYELTKEPRRIQQEKAIQEACMAAFPGQGEAELAFEALEYTPGSELTARLAENNVEIGTVFQASSQDGVFLGYVVESASKKGYGGKIVLYVGVDVDGTVKGVSILDISETPGLGMEAPNVLVPQFAGRNVDQFVFTKTGAAEGSNEVDAITSATITTRAVVNAVNGGLSAARELLEGGVVNE